MREQGRATARGASGQESGLGGPLSLRIPACREGNACEGLASCLGRCCVLVLSVTVLSSLRFPTCREGNAREGLASCLVWYCVFVLGAAVLLSLSFPARCEGEARYHLPDFALGALVSIIGGIALYMAVTIYHYMSASPTALCQHLCRLYTSPTALRRHRCWLESASPMAIIIIIIIIIPLLSYY